MIDKDGKEFDGYINTVCTPDGKRYKLQCEVVEVYAMTCPRCGGQLELKYGSGSCKFCGTNFTTQFKLTEVKNEDQIDLYRRFTQCSQ